MENDITELQKRRAENIIWNCAEDYSFTPDFRAFDSSGGADIYWNILFGSARRRYEYEKLEKLFARLDRYRDSDVYESIFWNALEPVLFRTELSGRPVLEGMRPEPADTGLKFEDDMTTDEIVETADRYFYENFGLCGDGKIRLKYRLPHMRRMAVDSFLQRGGKGVYRKLADAPERWFAHEKGLYSDPAVFSGGGCPGGTKLSESELRAFLETKFGKSVCTPEQTVRLETTASPICSTQGARPLSSAGYTAASRCTRGSARLR